MDEGIASVSDVMIFSSLNARRGSLIVDVCNENRKNPDFASHQGLFGFIQGTLN